MPNYVICPVTEADWDHIVDIQYRAFAQEPFCQLMNGANIPANHALRKDRALKVRQQRPEIRWIKVVDADDPKEKVLGAAMYSFNPNYVPTEKPMKADPDMFVWLEDLEDRNAAAALLNEVLDRKPRHIKEGHIQLDSLFVDPEYQGKGLGNLLIKWGLTAADHMMLPIWIEAAQSAHGFYLRHGFCDMVYSKTVIGKWDIRYSLMRRRVHREKIYV